MKSEENLGSQMRPINSANICCCRSYFLLHVCSGRYDSTSSCGKLILPNKQRETTNIQNICVRFYTVSFFFSERAIIEVVGKALLIRNMKATNEDCIW